MAQQRRGQLNKQQSLFVAEYLKDQNGTRAALAAGYSEKTAHVIAANLLNNVKVSRAIAEELDSRTKKTKIDADYVLKRLIQMDEMDVADICDAETGKIEQNMTKWPEVWRKSITSLSFRTIKDIEDGKATITQVLREVKLPAKDRLLELIGKHTNVGAWVVPETTIVTPPNVAIAFNVNNQTASARVTFGKNEDKIEGENDDI